MFWNLVRAVLHVFALTSKGPVDPDRPIPYEVTRYGPPDLESTVRARQALQGEGDDIRYNTDDFPSYAGINGSQYRWPQNTLIYDYAPEIDQDQKMKGLIDDAINQISTQTCVKFKRRSNEKSYVNIKKDPGQCYSYVGIQPSQWQPQDMSLDDDCGYIGTVVHEFLHALGCFHEHQRSDRDQHVIIHDSNIEPALIGNFNKTEQQDELTFGHRYDYNSIMHYGECAFTKDPPNCPNDRSLWTMEATDGTRLKEPYDRPGMNNNDIDLIKKLYNCP